MVEWRVIITCAGFIRGELRVLMIEFGKSGPESPLTAGSFFYRHPLLLKYEWYWRLEPEIKYFCDIT
jgi:glycosyl transferase family 15 (putative glycolipid 2-alpha-mannosyltransferase)